MSVKDINFCEVFANFWHFVNRAESDVRSNENRGRLPPICVYDPWDEAFAAAYEGVEPFLRRFNRRRFFAVQSGLAFRTGPIEALNAHQALMHFLNKPDELYGEIRVLDSSEFKAIKSAAICELHDIDDARIAKKRRTCTLSAQKRSELIELRAFVLDHHFPKSRPVELRSLRSDEIETRFGWSQPTVSRKMAQLFKTRNGMEAYAAVFGNHPSPNGLRQRFDDGTLSVDELWVDRKPDEDEDGETDGMLA